MIDGPVGVLLIWLLVSAIVLMFFAILWLARSVDQLSQDVQTLMRTHGTRPDDR